MKNIRNLLSVILITFLLLHNISQTFATITTSHGDITAESQLSEKNVLTKEIILAKAALAKAKNGSKYIRSIDAIVTKYKNNQKTLVKLQERLALISSQLKYDTSSKSLQIKVLLRYFNAKIAFELYNLSASVQKFQEFENPSISDSDKKLVEAELIKIQLNLLENGTAQLQKLIKEFETLSNYEQKGDFNLDIDVDHEQIGKFNTHFEINDYISKASNFDAQFSGHLQALINATPQGEEAIKLELKSFIDFISKDGTLYTLIKDLDITTEENIDDIKDVLDKLKAMAQENKYIKYTDNNNVEGLKILRSLAPITILRDGRLALSKPMFTAYKKEGNKFYIIPTKYGCDSLKKLGNKFDPFNGSSCSTAQYKDLLEELSEAGALYMEIGNLTKLGFEGITSSEIDTLEGYITFSDIAIEEVSLNIAPDQERYAGEGFSLSYMKNNALNFKLYADEGKADIQLSSKLDQNNKFNYIKFKGNVTGKRNTLESSLSLANKKLQGSLTYTDEKYDYDYSTGQGNYIPNRKIVASLSGNTNFNNTLENIHLEYTGIHSEDNSSYLTGKLVYSLPKIEFTNIYNRNDYPSELSFVGNWNQVNKNFDTFDFDFSVDKKIKEFNEESYTYKDTGKIEEVFHSEMKLQNNEISGALEVKNNGENIFSIETMGSYEKNNLSLENSFDINTQYGIYMGPSDEEIESLSGNFDFGYDLRSSKNNSNFFFNFFINSHRIIEVDMKNTGTIQYKNTNVVAPTNTIDFDEAFGN